MVVVYPSLIFYYIKTPSSWGGGAWIDLKLNNSQGFLVPREVVRGGQGVGWMEILVA